jgi:hypothetical protein
VVHEGTKFDVEYLKVFRILQNFKHMIAPAISSFFGSAAGQNIIADFKNATTSFPGRCVPTISFLFVQKALGSNKESKDNADLAFLEKAIDIQVRLLLKQAKLYVDSQRCVLFVYCLFVFLL